MHQVYAGALLYFPGAHGEHTPAPALLNCPTSQTDALAITEPAAHAYPAVQFPEQSDVLLPPVPNVPAGHAAVQLEDGSAVVFPYRPAGHCWHADAPKGLHWPTPQAMAVALVDPAGQM
jgi:hypothetical protein